jgi:hypothetical protein
LFHRRSPRGILRFSESWSATDRDETLAAPLNEAAVNGVYHGARTLLMWWRPCVQTSLLGRNGRKQGKYNGKTKDHTVKNVLLVNALLTILFLSDTCGDRVHEKRIADATPYPLPAGSQLLQDLASWRSRSPRWRSSCRPRNRATKN